MLHKRLEELRKKHKLTQKDLSSRLGIARTTYSGYELGTSEPDNETLGRIADFFNVNIDYLFGRTDPLHTIDFAKDDILNVPVFYQGMELTLDEKKELIAIIRAIFSARKAAK